MESLGTTGLEHVANEISFSYKSLDCWTKKQQANQHIKTQYNGSLCVN